MKIINPLDREISIQVKGGQKYTIEANGELNGVPQEHAEFWKGLHPFLTIATGKATEPKKEEEEVKEEIKGEEIDDMIDTIVKEVVKEKPKKKVKKVTKK